MRLLEGLSIDDLDGGTDNQKGYKSLLHGPEPRVESFPSFDREVDAIVTYLKSAELASTCLVTRTNEALDQYASALEQRGLATYRVRRTEAEDRRAPGVRLATMHRVKGLEFDRIVIARVNQGTVPLDVGADTKDPVIARERDVHERALLYVAATRAKREVLVTGFDEPSPYLE